MSHENKCYGCGHEWETNDDSMVCPKCGDKGKPADLSPLIEGDVPSIDELIWAADQLSVEDRPTSRERSMSRKVATFLRVVAQRRYDERMG